MHPYRMQRLLKDRGKDQVINVQQRASLYQTIGQLLRGGLITFWETTRQEGFPERTVYKLTEKGHQTAMHWLRDMLSTPAQEFPEFPAAVSLLPLLTPEDVLHQLEIRETKLTGQIAVLEEEIRTYSMSVSRLFLLEAEYLRIMREAEVQWVRSVIADVRSGQLIWNEDWMRPFVLQETEEDPEHVREDQEVQ